MASRELEESWKKTTAYLRDARSHLSEAAEGISSDQIAGFEGALAQNELELALDALEAAVSKSGMESLRVWELMILAAKNMDLKRHAARYEVLVTEVREKVEKHWRRQSFDD